MRYETRADACTNLIRTSYIYHDLLKREETIIWKYSINNMYIAMSHVYKGEYTEDMMEFMARKKHTNYIYDFSKKFDMFVCSVILLQPAVTTNVTIFCWKTLLSPKQKVQYNRFSMFFL